MSQPAYQPARLFTLEEANAMLPLVKAIATDLAKLAGEVLERRERLAALLGAREQKAGDPYSDELFQERADLNHDLERLQGYIDELRSLGVEAKGPQGLVDFPTMIDDRVAFLCWHIGEPEVLYWHEIDAGFAGRQPLYPDGLVHIGPTGEADN